MSSRIVANMSHSSILFSPWCFRLRRRNIPEIISLSLDQKVIYCIYVVLTRLNSTETRFCSRLLTTLHDTGQYLWYLLVPSFVLPRLGAKQFINIFQGYITGTEQSKQRWRLQTDKSRGFNTNCSHKGSKHNKMILIYTYLCTIVYMHLHSIVIPFIVL